MKALCAFILLQFMDLVTTLAALKMGGTEQNPLVAHLLAFGTIRGLIVSKLMATTLATLGAWMGKTRGLLWANLAFSGIVAWNIIILARLAF